MTFAHWIYIPILLILGFAGGWHMGTSSIQGEWDRAEKRRKDREEGKVE